MSNTNTSTTTMTTQATPVPPPPAAVSPIKVTHVDALVYELDDPRVKALSDGLITIYDFARRLTANDPMELMGERIAYIDDAALKRRIEEYKRSVVAHIKVAGGANPVTVWESRADVLKVFPELAAKAAEIEKEITATGCTSCQLGHLVLPFMADMFSIPRDGRDVSSLLKAVGANGVRKLKGEPADMTMVVSLPLQLMKVKIPFKNGKPSRAPGTFIPVGAPPPAVEDIPAAAVKLAAPTAAEYDAESPGGLPRQDCALCCRKHLGESAVNLWKVIKDWPDSDDVFAVAKAALAVEQALIILKETLQGYSPDDGFLHLTYAIGHLSEAADEIVATDQELAALIRAIRTALMAEV